MKPKLSLSFKICPPVLYLREAGDELVGVVGQAGQLEQADHQIPGRQAYFLQCVTYLSNKMSALFVLAFSTKKAVKADDQLLSLGHWTVMNAQSALPSY